ncbi:MAG: hypothetical protein HQ594_06180 [Candidatus Omnitrophica bacterium]|nr:hypothetical protein [Candidatus Omnitrophota bacterium]
MIPKIICFIFGHICREKQYTGETMQVKDPISGGTMPAPFYMWRYNSQCPRCGKEIMNKPESKKEQICG